MNIHTRKSLTEAEVKPVAQSLIPALRANELRTEAERKVP